MNFKREIGTGIFFLVLAALYFWGSLSISTFDPFSKGGLDSRSIPQMLSILIAGLSIVHITGNLLKLKKVQARTESDAQAAEKMVFKFGRSQRLMVITVLLICMYIFCFTRLGFILSSILYLLAEIFLLIPAEKRKKWAIFTVCFSAGVPVVIYFLFTKLLSMFLPRGLLG